MIYSEVRCKHKIFYSFLPKYFSQRLLLILNILSFVHLPASVSQAPWCASWVRTARGLTITPYSLRLTGDDLICTVIRLSLQQCVWMMKTINLPSRTGWRVWCADLKETKGFVLITKRSGSATAFIVILALHLANANSTENYYYYSAKQSKKKQCDFFFSYFSWKTQ